MLPNLGHGQDPCCGTAAFTNTTGRGGLWLVCHRQCIRTGRKKNCRNLSNWLCFTARRGEDSSTQRLHHVVVSRQSSHSMTSCPLSRSLLHLRFVLLVVSARLSSRHAISKLDNSPQHRSISCNAKQVNVQQERLMFCKDVCTLYHTTLRRAISRSATLFVCTLYHSTLR